MPNPQYIGTVIVDVNAFKSATQRNSVNASMYDAIVRGNGSVYTFDIRPYETFLDTLGISYRISH